MLILGIILILVGAAVTYLFPDQFARFAGAVCLILGVILVILGVLDAGEVRLDRGELM